MRLNCLIVALRVHPLFLLHGLQQSCLSLPHCFWSILRGSAHTCGTLSLMCSHGFRTARLQPLAAYVADAARRAEPRVAGHAVLSKNLGRGAWCEDVIFLSATVNSATLQKTKAPPKATKEPLRRPDLPDFVKHHDYFGAYVHTYPYDGSIKRRRRPRVELQVQLFLAATAARLAISLAPRRARACRTCLKPLRGCEQCGRRVSRNYTGAKAGRRGGVLTRASACTCPAHQTGIGGSASASTAVGSSCESRPHLTRTTRVESSGFDSPCRGPETKQPPMAAASLFALLEAREHLLHLYPFAAAGTQGMSTHVSEGGKGRGGGG